MFKTAARVAYHQGGDLRSLSIPLLALRVQAFEAEHKDYLKFQAAISGVKL